MTTIDTVVIGAGHAGLAVSRLLTDAGRDHVVLDRGRVGERWRTERWDSLHLLTPSWMTRLPGWELRRARPRRVPLGRRVRRPPRGVRRLVRRTPGRRDDGGGRPGLAVAAAAATPSRPTGAPGTPSNIVDRHRTARHARHPRRLSTGLRCSPRATTATRPRSRTAACSSSVPRHRACRSPTSCNRAGREVTLAVGRHTRMPRRYRGLDIFWWLETTGRLARTIDEMPDAAAARREPSLQLVGAQRARRAATR